MVYWPSTPPQMNIARKSLYVHLPWAPTIGTFRLEYEYDFRISIQLCSQSPHSSLLLTSCEEDYWEEIGVKCDYLMYKH